MNTIYYSEPQNEEWEITEIRNNFQYDYIFTIDNFYALDTLVNIYKWKYQ